ncbi:signal peptidase I [Marinobacterium aestuariivivens]|uniref:Signal peptidase I n=1 Tax=Marinobacterium aestuariivivens TaxID=1698799 RepID=A0ABW2A9M4_9GAMM
MRLVVKKESWPRFCAKAGIALTIIWAAGTAFADRYRIGIDSQVVKCIPGYSVYLIDKKDLELKRDAIYVFTARGLQPVYEDGTEMVKYLRGIPGDHIAIKYQGNIYVNDKYVGYGLSHAEKIGQPEESFLGEAKLKPGNYWFMGTSDQSFDSRYWGTVKDDQIIGRAYPLF